MAHHCLTMWEMPDDYSAFKESVVLDVGPEGLEVFEVWWEATARYPAYTPSQRLAVAERVVAELLADGRVQLYRQVGTGAEVEPVSAQDVAAALNGWAAWNQSWPKVLLKTEQDGDSPVSPAG